MKQKHIYAPTQSKLAPKKITAPAARWRDLAQAIAHANPAAPISHAECQATFDFYLDAARRGQDAPKLYPAIWNHLQTCADCHAAYAALSDDLTAEPPPTATLAPALPFPIARDPHAPWSQRVRSRIAGAPLNFALIIQPTHLAHLLSPAAALALRGEESPTGRTLVLSDIVTLDERQVAIELWLSQPPTTPNFRLDVLLDASEPLPEPLLATLQWNHHQSAKPIHAGTCQFDDIPLTDLAHADPLQIEFLAGLSTDES